MSLAKAVISGQVYRAPEKRFTTNNVPVATFTMSISDKEETLVRVIAKGNLAELIVNSVNKNDHVVVDGRLQTTNVKLENGAERKIIELDASSFEKLSGSSSVPAAASETDKLVKFSTEDFSDDLIGDDEIPF